MIRSEMAENRARSLKQRMRPSLERDPSLEHNDDLLTHKSGRRLILLPIGRGHQKYPIGFA